MVKGMAAVCVLVILAMTKLAQGFSCVEVTPNLVGCLDYLTGIDSRPPEACCKGVKKVKGWCVSTNDQKRACHCLKQEAFAIRGIKNSAVSSLPAACEQPLPFPVSIDFDCNLIG